MKRNLPLLGFAIGALLPLVGLGIVYLVLGGGLPFNDFLQGLVHDHDRAAKVLSLSVIINVIPFIYYTSKRLDYTARGILVATMLYFVFMVLLKWVWK